MQPKTATVDHALGDPVCVDCEKVVDNGFVCEGCGNPLHEDCGQFSKHAPSFRSRETEYDDDLAAVNEFLDWCQRYCKRLVYLAGNHEYRVERWAAESAQNYGMYRMLSPRLNISRGRKCFSWVDYFNEQDAEEYPHYKINKRIVAVHGWSYAVNAFILGYLGHQDDTMFTVKIRNNRAILPTGKEVTA